VLPSAIGQDEPVIHRLSGLSGREFGKAYMQYMIEDHQKDLAMVEQEAQQAQNPAVKAWAAQVATQLREHLRMAQTTAQELAFER
jgi:putative membrane protein